MGFLKRLFFSFLASFSAINQQVRSEPTIRLTSQASEDESDHLRVDLEVQSMEARSQLAFLTENSNLVRATRNGRSIKTPVDIRPSGDRIEIDE